MSSLRLTASDPRPDQRPDLDEVKRAIPILTGGKDGIEIRTLPTGASVVLFADNVELIAEAVAYMSENATGVYYTLNPVSPGLDHAARVGDVLGRRWLLVDVDRTKTDENKELSATEDEKEAAREISDKIMDYLATEWDWPAPVVIDSGNGWHQLYRIDLPNDKLSQAALRMFLQALSRKFDNDAAHVDTAVHNASRIAKLPGTWARKGTNTAERPHRIARLVFIPDQVLPVSYRQIMDVAESGEPVIPDTPPSAPSAPPRLRLHATIAGGADAWARRGRQLECTRMAMANVGNRHTTLEKVAFKVGQLIPPLDRVESERMVYESALMTRMPAREAEKTCQECMDAGQTHPREPVPRPDATPDVVIAPGERVIILASEVTPRKVEWLWPGRVPLGKLTTFAGVGGLGKTFALCDITAKITRGLPWPDSVEGECAEQGKVLFISGEDDKDDTLVPRMIECGADLTQVAFLSNEIEGKFFLGAIAILTAALEQIAGGTRLVVIDPPTSYLGGVNDHKNAELRGLLTPLKIWASEKRVAIIFNTHLNKAQGKVDAMMRVMGSVAWVNAVRAAHMFAADPDDRERRFFIPMKMNLAKERKGLAYKIVSLENEQAKVEWMGEVDTNADDAVNRVTNKPRGIVASEWLIERFREKLEWNSKELKDAASADNVSHNAMFEAKERLGLPKARKITHESGNISWVWWVPADWPQLKPKSDPPPVGGKSAASVERDDEGRL